MSLYPFVLVLLAFLDVICIIAVIFVERKNPASTIAWILVLVFIPFGGFIAYAIFGSGFHVNKKKRYALKQVSDTIYHQILSRYIGECEPCGTASGQKHERLIRYLENDGDHYFTQSNAVSVYTSGEEMFAAMMKDMRNADKHIHLLYYIFKNDRLGKEITAILTERARAGVEVKVIYDSLGSSLSSERMFKELRAAGGLVEAFSPLVLTLSSHLRLNYRNHRKITVIDGVIGYVGGMNVGEEYRNRHKRLKPWRDTHLRLTGSSVSFLQERFLMDWMSVDNREIPPDKMRPFFPPPLREGNIGVQIVSSGPDTTTQAIKSGLLEIIYSARKSIYIQTPYFIPDESFLDALRIAARSGVDVRLMLPRFREHSLVHWATLSYARQILEAGVRVFLYKGFLHAKTIVFDESAVSIGSANLDNRSFALNFEINAFIYDRTVAGHCEVIFLRDLENCTELREDWFLARHPVVRGCYSACRLLAPLM